LSDATKTHGQNTHMFLKKDYGLERIRSWGSAAKQLRGKDVRSLNS
jgi:hypothetical protein